MSDEMTLEEKYKRILSILATRNKIIKAQAEKILLLEETLENCLVTLPYGKDDS